MTEPADLGHLVHLGRFFLEAPDQEHLPVELEQRGLVREHLDGLGGALVKLHGDSWAQKIRDRADPSLLLYSALSLRLCRDRWGLGASEGYSPVAPSVCSRPECPSPLAVAPTETVYTLNGRTPDG